MTENHLDRFEDAYIPEPTSGCFLWTGYTTNSGYGLFRFGKRMTAHRASWTLYRGTIPKGDWVLHHCDTKLCVNPDHLYLGDNSDNMQDRLRRGRDPNKNKKHCPRGHPYNLANTFTRPNGHRKCRVCDRAKKKERLLNKC